MTAWRFLCAATTLLVFTTAEAQTLKLVISGQPLGVIQPGQEIARRTALRTWQDSVEVFAGQTAATHATWHVVTGNARANYLVSVVAVPIAKPGYSAMAMAVVVMEPGTLVTWKYLTHYVSVTESAPEAGASLIESTIAAISAARR